MKKIALAGSGPKAFLHATYLQGWGELKAVCHDKSGAENIVEETAFGNASTYVSFDELLASEPEIDLMIVCSATGFHAEQIIKALQAGKDVVCESPLCLTPAAAWQIIETAKFCRRKLFVVKPVLFHPVLAQLKSILANGLLGAVYNFQMSTTSALPNANYLELHGNLFPDGGLLYNLCSPYVDIVSWLFGEVASAKGFAKNMAHDKVIEFEDGGVVALEMATGLIGTFNWLVNATATADDTALTIVAEKATIKLGGEFLNQVQAVQARPELSLDLSTQPVSEELLYERLHAQFSSVFNDGTIDAFGVFDGLQTVEAINKIYKAVRQ